MELSEIASVSGKGGLFKVYKPTKSGIILESMDDAKTKIVATSTQRLSVLNEISIYTTTKDGSEPLEAVLKRIHEVHGNAVPVDANSDTSALNSFLKSVLPEFDESRVYASDIKKLVKWYIIIVAHAPEILVKKEEEKSALSE
jgi:hypothetical protein